MGASGGSNHLTSESHCTVEFHYLHIFVSFSIRNGTAGVWRAKQVSWKTKTEKESLFHVQKESGTYWVWMPVWKCLLWCTPLLRCTQLLLQLQSWCCWENQKRKSSSCWWKDPEDLNSWWNTKSFDHLQTKNWLEVFFFLVIGNVEQYILRRPLIIHVIRRIDFCFCFENDSEHLFPLQFLWLKKVNFTSIILLRSFKF